MRCVYSVTNYQRENKYYSVVRKKNMLQIIFLTCVEVLETRTLYSRRLRLTNPYYLEYPRAHRPGLLTSFDIVMRYSIPPTSSRTSCKLGVENSCFRSL